MRLVSIELGVYFNEERERIDLRRDAVNKRAAATSFPILLYRCRGKDFDDAVGEIASVEAGYKNIQILVDMFDVSSLDAFHIPTPSVIFDRDRYGFGYFVLSDTRIKPAIREDHKAKCLALTLAEGREKKNGERATKQS